LVKSVYFKLRNILPKSGTFPRDTIYIYIIIIINVYYTTNICTNKWFKFILKSLRHMCVYI